jgi:Flavodoxin-like fold
LKLLHIDSSILGKDSVTRQITAAAVKRLRDADSSLEVIYRDLFADPLSYLNLEDMPDYDLHLSLAHNAPPGTQFAHLEFAETYLCAVFDVIGIRPEIILSRRPRCA